MSNTAPAPVTPDSWFTQSGPESDVVVSTRLRLARNLSCFPFPDRVAVPAGERILGLVFDALSRVSEADRFQANRVDSLNVLRRRLFIERGLLRSAPPPAKNAPPPIPQGIVLRNDGKLVCTVNDQDHLRIVSYSTGLNTDEVWQLCHGLDAELQQILPFAASYEAGFLTSSLFDAGSGMKLSLHVHLPATELTDASTHRGVIANVVSRGFVVETYYGLNQATGFPFGSFYRIRNANAAGGTEFDQIASLLACAQFLVTTERNYRLQAMEKKPTILRDRVYRAFAAVKYGRFLEEREAICLLSDIKFGLDTEIIAGIDPNNLTALFYRIKNAHLEMLIRSGHFSFESDVASSERFQILRMRSLIIQEALEQILLQVG